MLGKRRSLDKQLVSGILFCLMSGPSFADTQNRSNVMLGNVFNQHKDQRWQLVLEQTQSQLWKDMSAKYAWLYWYNLETATTGNKQDIQLRSTRWQNEAVDFRKYVRFALRLLLKEDIKVDQYPASLLLSNSDAEWNEKTARIAWIFWLTKKTANERANQSSIKAEWEREAPEFRKLVRKFLMDLKKEGIGIVKG